MLVHLFVVAAGLSLAATAYAAQPDTRGEPIEEAHDTPPENKPRHDAGAASAGPTRLPPEGPDTRGVRIGEAHDTLPEDAQESTRGETIDEAHRTTPRDGAQAGEAPQR